jgi:hypothetical protein
MEEASENNKESPHSAHANGMNEFSVSLYQPDADPLVGLKHVAFINHFDQ